MKPIFNFIIQKPLPSNLEKLLIIAKNYWWSWNTNAIELFKKIDKELFNDLKNNPISLLNTVNPERLKVLSEDEEYINNINSVYEEMNNYLQKAEKSSEVIAYFSPEFGIHQSFPNYSGGLGILSGDHLKTASDSNIPIVGIGLLYQEGYFRQTLSRNGWQSESYPENDFYSLPMELKKGKSGNPIIIDIKIGEEIVYAQIWELKVGRVILYLMDTNIDKNETDTKRSITKRLYGGDRSVRIKQEILLGIGGVKVLNTLGIEASVIHINEGHAALALLERTKSFMDTYGINFWEASQITRASSVFTTHTPVPAGNEEFELDLVKQYLGAYCKELGIDIKHLFYLGRLEGNNKFLMTVLAFNLSLYHNGVSKLHGTTSKIIWNKLWNNFLLEEVPIGFVTNGVHSDTWISAEMKRVLENYSLEENNNDIDNISINKICDVRNISRRKLIDYSRNHLLNNESSYLSRKLRININNVLNYNTFTLGFARRFASYKRASLLFQDMNRLKEIVRNENQPVQIILAGKAHPHDTAGKETIQKIISKIKEYDLEDRIIFLEDYDIITAKYLVRGCDLWLNTPIRPNEASGTSGMKVALNGGINCSILDGWWVEAFNGKNGFTIGNGEIYENLDEQNKNESIKLYDLLESEIIDLYYNNREDGLSEAWFEIMKNSFCTISNQFSANRMIFEYNKIYNDAVAGYKLFSDNNATNAVGFNIYKDRLLHNWQVVNLFDSSYEVRGNTIIARTNLYLGELEEMDLKVQLVYGIIDVNGEFKNYSIKDMKVESNNNKISKYELSFENEYSGRIGVTFRVVPKNVLITRDSELNMCKWAENK